MREAAKTAAIVGALILAYGILQEVVMFAGYLGSIPADHVAMALTGVGRSILIHYLPFAVGVFVSLWLLAPVAAESSLVAALKRSIVATALGAVLVIVIRTLVLSVGAFSGVGSFFGNSFPDLPLGSLANDFGLAFHSGLVSFIQLLPPVTLVVVLLWMWLVRHPSRHAVSAGPTEV